MLSKSKSSEIFALDQIDAIASGICVLDAELVVQVWNATLTEWTGITREDAVGLNLGERFPHLISPRYKNRLDEVMESGNPTVFSAGLHKSFIPVSLSDDPADIMVQRAHVRRFDISSRYLVVTIEDVSVQVHQTKELRIERTRLKSVLETLQQRERDLADSEAKFRGLYESTGDAMMLINEKGIFDCNPATLELFGYKSKDKILGKRPGELSPDTQPNGVDSLVLADERFVVAFEEGGERFEWLHQCADGTLFPAEVLLNTFVMSGKTMLQAVVRDITERKIAEHRIQEYAAVLEGNNLALEEFNEAAEAASRAKSQFLANMSHELRTPLNSMLILAKSLAGNPVGNLTTDQVTAANVIHSGGQELLMLINDILDLAKVESGRLEAFIEHVHVRAISDRLCSQFLPMSEQRGLLLKTELADDLPDVISTDIQKVEQILRNLLSNAMKFTETGSILLKVSRPDSDTNFPKSELTPDTAIAFSVIDTGIGIPDDKQYSIFESFQQVDGSTSRKYGGTGLGLTISREFATLLGGEIQLHSRVGEGSTFTLYLPPDLKCSSLEDEPIVVDIKTPREETVEINSTSKPEQTSPAPKESEPHATHQIIPDAADRLHGKKVLLVDDDMRNLFAMSSVLESSGMRVVLAENGSLALDALEREKDVDVVLMDIMMPVMNGFEAIARIRTNELTSQIPVIALTAKAMPEDRLKCIEAGADDYLPKPVDIDLLLSLICEWIFNKAK